MRAALRHGDATRPRRRSGGALLAVALLIGLISVLSRPDPDEPAGTAAMSSPPPPSSVEDAPASVAPPGGPAPVDQGVDDSAAAQAAAALTTLPTKGRAPQTGYSRAQFGDAWSDDVAVDSGHNGCDTRNDVLRRDLVDVVLKPGSNGCAVQSGTLHDLYTASTIAFARGSGTSSAVQIDHLVALSDAWQKGAQQLTAQQRIDFANDPLNLQAVDGPTNQAKGAGDAATWLPPNKAYRCTYVSRQVEVKAKYGLWVTKAERDAMAALLAGCGVNATPTTQPSTTPPPQPGSQTTQPSPQTAALPPAPPSEVYYENCSAAKAAGAAPLYAGQAGYRPQLDRDKDGVACEN